MFERLPATCTTALLALAATLGSSIAHAQQVTIAAPRTSLGDNFYENFGVNFGFNYDSPTSRMFFRNGGGAPPVFGGFDPNAQSSFGTAGQRGNWSWDFGVTGGQGSTRSNVTTTPMLTVPNGGFGFLNNTTTRPFVTGIVPVVNDRVLHREQLRRNVSAATQKVAARKMKEQRDYQRLRQKVNSAKSKRSTQQRSSDPPLVLGDQPTGSQ